MRRALLTALGAALACAALAAPAQGAFGLSDFDVFFAGEGGLAATQAGSHPEQMEVSFTLNSSGVGEDLQPDGEIRDATFVFPPGFLANPIATERCTTADFLARPVLACTAATQVGEVTIDVANGSTRIVSTQPLYNLEPPPGRAARLGFAAANTVPVVIDGAVRSEPPFNVLGILRNTRQALRVFGAETILTGAPGEVPFLTLPTACTGPVPTTYEALSWEGDTDSGSVLSHDSAGNPAGFSGCDTLPFTPKVDARPTTDEAASSSGLAFELGFDQDGLLNPAPDAKAESALKKVEVTLPKGMTVNPSIAEGLGVCEPDDLDDETLSSDPGEGCPSSSKIGTIESTTPLLEETLRGSVFLAEQDDPATSRPGAENPFDSLIAFYIVIKDPQLGILLKLPALVEPDKQTGQLTTTVDQIPQLPISTTTFRFREGQRAPLITPPDCGTHTVVAKLTPWARPGDEVTRIPSFEIEDGPAGAPCPPDGALPFAPGFQAGSASNAAGAFSPFLMRITRPDGHQSLTRFSAILPPGVTGRLAGLAQCPEGAIALARAKTGRAEQQLPSCPNASLIGHTLGGAGAGTSLTYVPGTLHLAGPYRGAPLSVVAITPAVAGPFDAGNVVVRVALDVDPVTGEVAVDGNRSDPIPHILQGIPLAVRDLRVATDRPGFTLNPTSCEESGTRAFAFGSFADLLDPADDLPVPLFARYQAAGCGSLGFAPRLGLRLKGGTRRGAFPALRAVYVPRPGDANVRRLALRFPRSAFVEQGHIRTICTRVQFAAPPGHGAQCPQGSVYGHVRAFTPLLDEPLEGPAFLRSSNNNLPDVVFALKGIVDVEVAVRIDSVKGVLRATVARAPDVPVSRVVVRMAGGQRGLFVNSRNLCAQKSRAYARLDGHNAKRAILRPLARPQCGARQASRSHRRR